METIGLSIRNWIFCTFLVIIFWFSSTKPGLLSSFGRNTRPCRPSTQKTAGLRLLFFLSFSRAGLIPVDGLTGHGSVDKAVRSSGQCHTGRRDIRICMGLKIGRLHGTGHNGAYNRRQNCSADQTCFNFEGKRCFLFLLVTFYVYANCLFLWRRA